MSWSVHFFTVPIPSARTQTGPGVWSGGPGTERLRSVDSGVDTEAREMAPCPGACGPDAGAGPQHR